MRFILSVLLTSLMLLWVGGNFLLQPVSAPPRVVLSVPSPGDEGIVVRHPLPTHVQCGPYRYSIKYHDLTFENAMGDFNSANLIIRIQPGLPSDQERSTLYHELSHCALANNTEIALLDKFVTIDNTTYLAEDQWIEAVTPNMVRMLRENPQIVDYLLERK